MTMNIPKSRLTSETRSRLKAFLISETSFVGWEVVLPIHLHTRGKTGAGASSVSGRIAGIYSYIHPFAQRLKIH